MSRILVALSLNEQYNSLVSYAIWLAKQLSNKTSIELLTVQDYSFTPPTYLLPYLEEERRRYANILEGIIRTIKGYGIDATYTVAKGRLIDTFKKAICSLNIDLLVLGYKSHLLRMSSSENMVRSINIPMFVCKGQKASRVNCLEDIDIKTVLCLTDFSENSIRAFDFMKTILANCKDDVKVILLNMISSIRVEEIFKNVHGVDRDKKEEFCDHLTHEALQHLQRFESEGFSLEVICKIGIAYKTINDILRQRDVDLIFMGARGIAQTEGFRIGSLTESILKTSSCPVVVVT
ncbi:MAG: universal stress protein [Thermodesulfovibrionales bacterium]